MVQEWFIDTAKVNVSHTEERMKVDLSFQVVVTSDDVLKAVFKFGKYQ